MSVAASSLEDTEREGFLQLFFGSFFSFKRKGKNFFLIIRKLTFQKDG